MSRKVRAILTALLAMVAAMALPADPAAAAAACSAESSRPVTGGYDVSIFCSGAGFVHGFGSTLTDANLAALQLYQLYADTGVNCSGESVRPILGGYDLSIFCTGAGFVHGFGSSLTDAATEARLLATLYATRGRNCSDQTVRGVSGGYDVSLFCTGLGFVHGVGSTLTGAAGVARLTATIG
jgi:hypothetical protein